MSLNKLHSTLLSFTLIFSLSSRTAHAETNAFAQTSSAPPSVSDLQAAADEQMKKAQAALKNNDRKDGNGAAQAMAMVGAALAGASCMMLMKAAQEEEDPVHKKELMGMAMKECAQAAQSAGNAAQNGANKDQLAYDDSPKPTQAETPNTPTPSYQTPTTEQTPVAQYTPEPQVTNPDKALPVSPQVFDQVSLTSSPTPTGGTSKLNPIGDQLAFDDNAKGTSSGVSAQNALGSFGFGSGSLGSGSSALATANAVESLKTASRKNKNNRSNEESSSASGGESRSFSEGEGGSDVNGMLSRIMGGNKDAGDDAHGGAQMPDLNMARAKGRGLASGAKVPNIFEYASYRMHKAQNDGEIKGGKRAKTLPPPKNVALVKK
jgi:hypothetical protein